MAHRRPPGALRVLVPDAAGAAADRGHRLFGRRRAPTGGYQAAFTFENYLHLRCALDRVQEHLTLAPLGTLICLPGYPAGLFPRGQGQ